MTDPQATPQNHATAPTTPRRRRTRKQLILALLAPTLLLTCLIALLLPSPYVVTTPGPTFDLKETIDGNTIINIAGTDPTTGAPIIVDNDDSGDLRMVTISEYGGPGHRLSYVDALALKLQGPVTFQKYSDIYPDDITAEQIQSFNAAQMTSSHSTASVAALEELGWNIPATVTVNEVAPDADAHNKLQPGDRFISITTPDGTEHPINKASTIFALTAATPPGTELLLNIDRNGQPTTIRAKTHESPDGIGSKLGIYLHIDTQVPLDITFNLESVGGPSAGMMFALAIIDKLTPGDMTGGHAIAGTGAIGYDGRILPIGGLEQKIYGAQKDGAQYFLAPTLNCDELNETPEGINVFRVDTLSEARAAVATLAQGKTDGLRACVAGK